MRNIKIHLCFDGTRFHGWQVQKNAVTLQETFQDAVEKVFQERLAVTGCSRTDAGVHANEYVCAIKTDSKIPCRNIMRALNAHLPHDIAVTGVEEAPEDFHPRYSAKGKEYIYKIDNGEYRNPFMLGFAYYYPKKLDCELLNRAASMYLGTHDFAAFCSAGADAKSRPENPECDTIRTIFESEVTREGSTVIFRVHGNGFLYNMVRIMVGTLLAVALGRIKPEDIPDIIDSKDRKRAGTTAPAHGLYLNRVFYE